MALDINIINVAVPKIASDFRALEDVAWYGAAYLLTVTAFQPAFGNIYKYFDVEVTYKICLAVFERAAGILQGALAIISHVVELQKRPLYMGIVISVFVVTVSIGPVLGGVFTAHTTWRWCFWINLPIGVLVLFLLTIFLKVNNTMNANQKLPLKVKLGHMDPLGCVVFLGAICCLLLALQWGGQSRPWRSAMIIGLLLGSSALLVLFGFIQWRLGEKATIPLRILRQRSILAGAATLFFLGAALNADSFHIPFWFQAVQGVDAMTSGIRLIPLFIPQMVSLIVVGAVVSKWGYYVPYMILGELVCIAGSSMLTRLSTASSTVYWSASLATTGLGMGMAMQLPYTAVQMVLSNRCILLATWRVNNHPPIAACEILKCAIKRAVSIAAGQTMILNTILKRIPMEVQDNATSAITAALRSEATASPQAINLLRSVWNTAICRIMLFSLVMVCTAVPFTLGMEWINTKNHDEQISESERSTGEDH
ncbi:MAG: hypothetical protein Q9216_005883 [Gyalolechia sp. 2 TL-2023]